MSKQSKKEDKPLIAKIPEPVKKREDNADKKRPRMEESKSFSYWRSDLSSENVANVNVLHDKPLIAKIPEPVREREDSVYKKRPRTEESKSFSDLSSENVANVNVLHGKPLIAEILEPVKKREDGKDNAYKKRPRMEEEEIVWRSAIGNVNYSYGRYMSGNVSSSSMNNDFNKMKTFDTSPYCADVSSSPMNNDFNKVKTFDIRGVTEDVAK